MKNNWTNDQYNTVEFVEPPLLADFSASNMAVRTLAAKLKRVKEKLEWVFT